MKIGELFANSPVEIINKNKAEVSISQIVIDSRKAEKASLFVCLPGSRVDGHDYAESAYKNGCRVFLVERLLPLNDDAIQLLVQDTRALLPLLASRFYGEPSKQLQLIGITGTKGKTTTSLMIYSLLEASGIPVGYIGSNGVRYGKIRMQTTNTTPESLELHQIFRSMVDYGTKVCVMEVSSQALDHHRIDGLSFVATAFLNLSNDHIGPSEHPSFDAYKNAKKKLFSCFESDNIIYNADDPYSEFIISGSKANRISFSLKNGNYTASKIQTEETAGILQVHFQLHYANQVCSCSLPFPGEFNVLNALCALAIVSLWHLPIEKMVSELALISIDGRCEVINGFPGRIIVIDYAHNKTSMEQTLMTLRKSHKGRIVVIYGSVGGRTENRRKDLGEVCSSLADYSIITSDNPDFEDPAKIIHEIASYYPDSSTYMEIPDRRAAIQYALKNSHEGDLLLFAGKGHENYQLIQGKKLPFSEKDIILSFLKTKS